MEQPYRANVLIVKSVGMLPGASAEYASLSINLLHIKIQAVILEQPHKTYKTYKIYPEEKKEVAPIVGATSWKMIIDVGRRELFGGVPGATYKLKLCFAGNLVDCGIV